MAYKVTNGVFLSTAAVAATLACVAVLAVVSALVLAPLERPLKRRRVAAFFGCLMAIWVVASFVVEMIRGAL